MPREKITMEMMCSAVQSTPYCIDHGMDESPRYQKSISVCLVRLTWIWIWRLILISMLWYQSRAMWFCYHINFSSYIRYNVHNTYIQCLQRTPKQTIHPIHISYNNPRLYQIEEWLSLGPLVNGARDIAGGILGSAHTS